MENYLSFFKRKPSIQVLIKGGLELNQFVLHSHNYFNIAKQLFLKDVEYSEKHFNNFLNGICAHLKIDPNY